MRIGWKVACAIILIASSSVVMTQFQPKESVLTKVIEINIQKGAVGIPNSIIASISTNLSSNKSFNSGLVDKRGKELIISEITGDKVAVYVINLSDEEKQIFENCSVYIKIYNDTMIPIEGEINILEDEALCAVFPTGEWDFALKVYGNSSLGQKIDFNITTNLDITATNVSVKTNEMGQYIMPNLLPGHYCFTVYAENYTSQTKHGVVEAGKTTKLDFQLESIGGY